MNDGKLHAFLKLLDQDIISAIDVAFCRFLQEISPDIDESVLLAACITSRAYQNGDVCILLDDYAGRNVFSEALAPLRLAAPKLEPWLSSLGNSSVVGRPGHFKPLVLDEAHRLYFHRLWRLEQNLVQQIFARVYQSAPDVDLALLKSGLDRLFNNAEGVNWQKVAAVAAVHNLFTVISGGPGTGKTTTVARFLALILEQGCALGSMPSIALAAPTGKAAARLQSSIAEAKASLQTDDEIKESIPASAVTIHQLMGARRHTARLRYNAENLLPYDCIVIDEVSMVDQVLMSRLMDALHPQTRLLMLGDKDQLASVEAGSVLGDICGDMNQNVVSKTLQKQLKKLGIDVAPKYLEQKYLPLTGQIILLNKSYRFDEESGIGRLSKAVNRGDAKEALSLLDDPTFPSISMEPVNAYDRMEDVLFDPVLEHFRNTRSVKNTREMLKHQSKFKILAAHRRGPWGVQIINNRIEQILKRQGVISAYDRWYEGRPIMVNRNDYSLDLRNGDLGICVRDDNSLKVCFTTHAGILKVTPSRLPEYSTAFALTIHKSQGSEFDNILLVLPEQLSPLLSRELFYTAVTRAREKVTILGDAKVIRWTIENKVARNSGLKDYLWQRREQTDKPYSA